MKRAFMALCALFFALGCSCAFAFESLPLTANYLQILFDDENGLLSQEANVVLHTSDGYIWVGSYSGLSRFDGTKFVTFSSPENDVLTFVVRALIEDSKGRLWIATNDNGLFVYDNGKFTKIAAELNVIGKSVRALCEDADGNIFVGSTAGLAIVDQTLSASAANELLDYTNPVVSLALDHDGRIWGVTQEGGVFAIDRQKKRAASIAPEELSEKTPLCVTVLRNGCAAVGTSGSKLIILWFEDDGEVKRRTVDTPGAETINAIYQDKSDRIWICADTGMAYFDTNGGFVTQYDLEISDFFSSMTEDYEGNYWFASSRGGVLELTHSKFVNINSVTGLSDVTVNATIIYKNELFAATDSGIQVFDENYKSVYHPMVKELEGIRVRSMYIDSSDRLWFCTYKKKGVVCWDGAKCTSIGPEQGLISEKTRQIIELKDGGFAVATGGGVSFIRNLKPAGHVCMAEGLKNDVVLCLLETSDGRLLAGTDGGGIFQIDGGRAKPVYENEPLIAGSVILRMIEDDKNGCIWISNGELVAATESGVRQIDDGCALNGSAFDIQLTDDKLFVLHNSAIAMLERGLALYDEPQPEVLDKNSGLVGNVTSNSWHCLKDGILHISTGDGVYLIDTNDLYQNQISPKTIINSVEIDGARIVNPSGKISMDANARSLTIDFAVLSFNTEDSEVRYWLEGFDEAATYVKQSDIEKVRYTNLDGGKYTFHLFAQNADGVPSAAEQTIVIEKSLRVSEQKWFIALICALCVICAILLTLYIGRIRTARILKRQAEYRKITSQLLLTTANVIDARDKYTHGHSLRVALLSKEIYRRLGKNELECENLYFTALLHDIGKIGVPDGVLNKPGKLTPQEFDIMKTHPVIGGEILKDVDGIPEVANGAMFHHERLDGSGYPRGLKGESIPFIAQVISVADSVDAMTSDRVYRPRLAPETVIAELKKGSGTQFDADIAKIAIDMLESGFIENELARAEEESGAESKKQQ